MMEEIKAAIMSANIPFVQLDGTANVSDGWKLSIQGSTVEDVFALIDSLMPFLTYSRASFKFATKKLINMRYKQQSNKLLTVYIPNGVEVKSFAELVYLNMAKYGGGDGIAPKGYNHYKGGIWYRNDRDESGNYVNPYK